MKKNILFGFLVFSVAVFAFNYCTGAQEEDVNKSRFFKVDSQKKEITGPEEKIADSLKLNLVSVTVDQPQYWPWEDVNLKVLMPDRHNTDIEISVQKRDATPKELGKFTLTEDGILVKKIMSGKEEKLELGEYRVNVCTTDKTVQGTAEFSVVEGALGALSFAYEFRQLTEASDLAKAKGGWFMGNASGAGLRWGNGLNIKNELRVSNQPYSGKVTIKSRCFLPGCNGCEAGEPVTIDVKDGLIEAVMDVGGHSGPFEIEAITDKGSVKFLFEASGHIERAMVMLSQGMTYAYRAGLAPYEGTIQVPGRQIYIDKEKEKKDDPIELTSAFSDLDNKITISVCKAVEKVRVYVWVPEPGGKFVYKELTDLPTKLERGEKIVVPIEGPYSLITTGGYLSEKGDFWEGYAIVFTPSALKVNIESPEAGSPTTTFKVNISTINENTGKGVPIAGVLEVYDNRVASKNPVNPLTSAIGDSFRNAANSFSYWEDRTGMDMLKSKGTSRGGAHMLCEAPMSPAGEYAEELKVPEEGGAEGEAIRQGEEKVVYCGMIKTDNQGNATVEVKLPPQIGRCNIRFAAVKDMDYTFNQKTIDVTKKAYVECHLLTLLVLNSKVIATAFVFNSEETDTTLKISGAGLDNPLAYEIKPGGQEIEFPIEGKNYGKLIFELISSFGKILDKRELEIRDISSQPATFSKLVISENKPISVNVDEGVAVYANAGQLLNDIVMNITITMYSWFGHAEALSASCSIRAILLLAIDKGIINDNGLCQTLKVDLEKTVRDLKERFYDNNTGLFSPYPGIETNTLWSAWTARNLNLMVQAIKKSTNLSNEFSETVKDVETMINKVSQALEKLGQSIPELAGYDPSQSNRDVIPVEIDGQVYYKVITDDAVAQWAVKKFLPVLDLPKQDLNAAFIKAYDTWRFLRAFEHTGLLPYLIQNAKALWLAGEKGRAKFNELFSQIAKGAIASQEPGMIQGPALLGGVYSSPQTMVRFLELLIMMSEEKAIPSPSSVKLIWPNKEETATMTDKPLLICVKGSGLDIIAPQYCIVRIDQKKIINLGDYVSKEPFFKVELEKSKLAMGEEGSLLIELDKVKDPFEYYAIIALPSTVSLRQTEDILSDYKGLLLYGQKTSGGTKIQLVTVPFRGSRKMILSLEGAQKGISSGWVLVRHINNPDDIATVKISETEVN